jgi:type IX secretion system PorP/SprF family membrane protein
MISIKKMLDKIRVFALIILCFVIKTGYSQELNIPVATQYLADNPFVISPTFAGIGDNFRIRLNGFAQWVGIKDSPMNQAVYADFRIADQSGIGVSLYNDKNGFTRQTGGKVSFAHHIIVDYNSKQFASFGISYNLNNFRIEIDKFNQQIFDPSVINDRFTNNSNFDVGGLYRNKGYYISFNASNLLKKDIQKFNNIEPSLLRNYQIYTGYIYKSNRESRVELEPSAFFQHF